MNRQTPFSEQTKELNYTFESVGFFAFDPRIPMWFNKAVMAFNENMRDQHRNSAMHRLTMSELMSVANGSLPLYPRVDLETLNFEWWTDKNAVEERPQDTQSPNLSDYI